MNSQRIDYGSDKIYRTSNESNLYWLPFLYTMPQTTRITLQRQRYTPDNNRELNYFNFTEAPIDYFSVLQDLDHFKTQLYPLPIKNPLVWSHIQFDVNQDLIWQFP